MTSEDEAAGSEDSDFNSLIKKSFEIIDKGVKASNALPADDNFEYYSCFPTFSDVKNEQSKKIVQLMQSIIGVSGIAGNIVQRDTEEKYDLLLEANDILLDRANGCMDIESGISKNSNVELIVTQARVPNVLNGCWNTASYKSKTTSPAQDSNQSVRLLAGKNIQRPQLTFKDKIDNSQKPWQPKIKDKPNSLKPLALEVEYVENGQEIFCHPYEFELDKFETPTKLLLKKKPIKFKSIEETPLILIEKVEDLNALLKDLLKQEEIAIDLEHHAYRSFQGITCLMQISTKDTDYLIDTLTLRSELHILNEVFTKPTILKVLHGADSDILWLQRDLSLYIVNMFDTHQAAKQLALPFLSLAYLLKTYCEVDKNKNFQLADWRIRPLPEELMRYARDDTHYLLYLKDILSNALIDSANGQNNILKAVYTRSNDICKSTYTKPIWTETSYLNMYRKSQKMFNNRQLFALKELHQWRDETARLEDDSTNYVLPNHMMLNIAEVLPREMQGILACCNPIPPLVRQNLLKIHKMILKAREQPLIKPILEDDMRQRLAQRSSVLNSESWMVTPHDIPSGAEARANLPCLLQNSSKRLEEKINKKREPTMTVFDDSSEEENRESKSNSKKTKRLIFVSPFERYKKVQPFVFEQEKKEREEKEKEEAERKKELEKSQKETEASISRVYDHFKEVAQNQPLSQNFSKTPDSFKSNSRYENIVHKKETRDVIKTPNNQSFKQMHGNKRKRQPSPNIDTPKKKNFKKNRNRKN